MKPGISKYISVISPFGEYRAASPVWVIRCRSLRDENRSMSAMPRKRRLAVKASSVAMGHKGTFACLTLHEAKARYLGGTERHRLASIKFEAPQLPDTFIDEGSHLVRHQPCL